MRPVSYTHLVDVDLVRGRLIETGEVAAEHEEVRTHRERERAVVVMNDAAVRADRDEMCIRDRSRMPPK